METDTTEIKTVENMDVDCTIDSTIKNNTASEQTSETNQVFEDSKVNQEVGEMRVKGLDTAVGNTGDPTAMTDPKSTSENGEKQCVTEKMMEPDSERDQHQTDVADHKVDVSGQLGIVDLVQTDSDKVETTDGQMGTSDQVGTAGGQVENVEPKEGNSLERQEESVPTSVSSESSLCSVEVGCCLFTSCDFDHFVFSTFNTF